jgi:hypothetical protein
MLSESRSFGKAFSTAKRDSTTPPAETDWIAGDTLTARFHQEQDSATARPRTRLRQIVSLGGARALTHHPEKNDTTHAPPAINYSRGHQIDITMLSDRIDRVIVAGKADGIHLEPHAAVVADSLKRAGQDSTRTTPPPAVP